MGGVILWMGGLLGVEGIAGGSMSARWYAHCGGDASVKLCPFKGRKNLVVGVFRVTRVPLGGTVRAVRLSTNTTTVVTIPRHALRISVPMGVSSNAAGMFANCHDRRDAVLNPTGNNMHCRRGMDVSRMGALTF